MITPEAVPRDRQSFEDRFAERSVRRVMGLSIAAIALIGAVAAFSDDGPASTPRLVIAGSTDPSITHKPSSPCTRHS